MKITVEGTPKEIADIVLALQCKQKEIEVSPLDVIKQTMKVSLDGIPVEHNENAPHFIIAKVTRYGVKVNGVAHQFADSLLHIGDYVIISSQKEVFDKNGKFLGNLFN